MSAQGAESSHRSISHPPMAPPTMVPEKLIPRAVYHPARTNGLGAATYEAATTFAAARTRRSTSLSVCASEMNMASNCDGGR